MIVVGSAGWSIGHPEAVPIQAKLNSWGNTGQKEGSSIYGDPGSLCRTEPIFKPCGAYFLSESILGSTVGSDQFVQVKSSTRNRAAGDGASALLLPTSEIASQLLR